MFLFVCMYVVLMYGTLNFLLPFHKCLFFFLKIQRKIDGFPFICIISCHCTFFRVSQIKKYFLTSLLHWHELCNQKKKRLKRWGGWYIRVVSSVSDVTILSFHYYNRYYNSGCASRPQLIFCQPILCWPSCYSNAIK